MDLLPDYLQIDAIKKKLQPILESPEKLKLVVVAGITVAGIVFAGIPFLIKQNIIQGELFKEKERSELISQIQTAKTKMAVYKKRLNKKGDLNWWISYVLEACRNSQLKVIEYVPFEPKAKEAKPGNLKGYVLRFKLEGSYENIFHFVNWIESNEWGMRIPLLKIEKMKSGEELLARVSIAILTSRKGAKKNAAK